MKAGAAQRGAIQVCRELCQRGVLLEGGPASQGLGASWRGGQERHVMGGVDLETGLLFSLQLGGNVSYQGGRRDERLDL